MITNGQKLKDLQIGYEWAIANTVTVTLDGTKIDYMAGFLFYNKRAASKWCWISHNIVARNRKFKTYDALIKFVESLTDRLALTEGYELQLVDAR